jgi:hypothetical protein
MHEARVRHSRPLPVEPLGFITILSIEERIRAVSSATV